MEGGVRQRRSYDSPRRREQAAETRQLVLAAAQALFESDGYSRTSMAAIASAAGVALKTVYLGFANKPTLLRAVWHRALRGEHDENRVEEQDWFREMLSEPDPRRRLALNARNSRAVKERAGAILEVIRASAPSDPEIGELWASIQSDFHANQRLVIDSLAADRVLRDGLDTDTAADVLWTLNHPALYHLLTAERGWSAARYEHWLGELLGRELLREGG